MSGFAWSKSSGWIAFNAGPNPVKYNHTTGLFSGFAWSKNLGYISMDGLQMVTQVPRIVNNTQDVTVANHVASLGSNSGPVNGLDGYSLDINKWNDSNINLLSNNDPKSSVDGSFTWVDVRLAKDYSYKITDPFGNYSSGTLNVVANIPSDTLESWNTISDGSTAFTAISGDVVSSSSGDKKADGLEKHFIKINLHDKYGNEVKTVPDIKNVIARIKIDNTVSPNQTNFDSTEILADDKDEVGRSINLSSLTTNFDSIFLSKSNSPILSTYSHTFSGTENPNGQIDITSYMPTNSNLSYEISYEVTPNSLDVWWISNTIETVSFSFIKLWDGTFQLINPSGGSFWINLPFQTSSSWSSSSVVSWESNAETYHLYTTQTGSSTPLHSLVTFTGANDPDISSHIWDDIDWFGWNYTPRWNSPLFDLTPKMNWTLTWSVIDFQLNHQVIRKFQVWWNIFAYKVGWASGTWVTQNRWIKILGSASSGNKDAIFALNDTDTYVKVGNFQKPQVRDMIMQNVEALRRNTPSDVLVVPVGDYAYDSGAMIGKRTLIVQWNLTLNDVTIWSNANPMAIIVLGGDVIIGDNVTRINASIFTNKWVKSIGDPINKQLYIYGTLISGNTIGTTAKLANTVCPDFFGTSCSETDKKAYDLNFLRSWATGASSYPEYSLVIEYNPKLTSDPPPGFKKIAR
jgi:hypothetical protein